ncbi:VOC family protein [Actinomycetospora cinnamomea]|uniref:Glyoxalase/bleomycin resistance protein/dioxygenase superfamily protein n=1 Tax=Actinomycetospora cinnamomea TaxID=663609 RepID=A0A2U1FSA1_9PSEU|nr:VOC family protein [Actinomycetospora cinnamomea]PVZ15049.1 glyoxalase/bleomycin resistance protein/dioxygenase superfamily protein [Actinomycetospora cinnamomea]
MSSSRPLAVAVDARDPEALAAFWCAVLDTSVVQRWTDAHGTDYIGVGLVGDVVLLFQAVADPTPGKNRVHLDVAATDDQRAEVERLVGLGARVLDEAPDHPWVVLADPEDNEFCVLAPR